MLLAHALTPLTGALASVAIGVIIGLGIAALLSYQMHRADHYRLRRLRQTCRSTVSLLEDADEGGEDMDHASHHAVHLLRVGLATDRSLAAGGKGKRWH